MKKLLLLLLLSPLLSYTPADTDVYLCDSKGGKKYHLAKNCRGLKNCKAEVIKVSLANAKSTGKTLCGYED